MKFKVICNLDYIMGHLSYAHLEDEIEAESAEELLQKFQDPRFKKIFKENAELILDDWEIYETGDIIDFEIKELLKED